MIINQNLNVNFHDIPHWIVAKIWMDKSLLVFLWFDIQSADIFFSLSLFVCPSTHPTDNWARNYDL